MKPIHVTRVPKAADEVKIVEIELAVTMACHSAMMTIDHLGEVSSFTPPHIAAEVISMQAAMTS